MLHNLLPPLRTEYVEREKNSEHFDWKPLNAHPLHGKISRTLETYIDQRSTVEKPIIYTIEKYPHQEPNISYVEKKFLACLVVTDHHLMRLKEGSPNQN